MHIDGACHCGAITYEAEIDPDRVVICHCTDCQTLSGSPFRVAVQSLPGTFRLLSGTPRTYTKIAESGNARAQVFCADCGAPIYAGPADAPPDAALSLRVGTIRQRDQLIPKDQFWARSAQSWLDGLTAIHHWDTQPAFRPGGAFK